MHEHVYLCICHHLSWLSAEHFGSEVCQRRAGNGDTGGKGIPFLVINGDYPFFKSLSFCITSIGSLKPTAF